jgi:hypothetical protein
MQIGGEIEVCFGLRLHGFGAENAGVNDELVEAAVSADGCVFESRRILTYSRGTSLARLFDDRAI